LSGSLIYVFGETFDPVSTLVDFDGVAAGALFVVDPAQMVVITPSAGAGTDR